MKRLVASLCVSLLVACGGGGGGGGGPTEPTPTPTPAQSRLLLNVLLLPVSAGSPEEATLSLDGREVNRTTGCSGGTPCALTAMLSGATRGSHTVQS